MTLRLMLDTDVISYVVKGQPPEFRRQKEQRPLDALCVSAVTQAELMYGLSRLVIDHRARELTDALLGSITVLDWPSSAASTFALIKRDLVRRGQIIGKMDLLIAAHALDAGLTLVTGNLRHFERIPGLPVVSWREESAN